MPERPIRDVGVRPTGDDQRWKEELERIITELIRRDTAKQSRIEALEKRVR